MQIDIAGHHLEITEAIRESINTKFLKVASHYPNLESLNATVSVEKRDQKITVDTQYLGERISAHASNADLYGAIADAAKKLESALSHRKGAIKNIKHTKPDLEIKESTQDIDE